jgi:isorenieratene synthase
MKLKERIRKKLRNYRIPLNSVDESLPKNISAVKNVAVIGGGIAGISAAANLLERGFSVDLYERETFIGGKVGSWTFESNGERLRTEHGFHGFFKQYFNLRSFMEKTGSIKHLQAIEDYVILYDKDKKQGFKDMKTTPGLNILSLRKQGIYGIGTFFNPFSVPYLNLLRYHPEKTFRKYDHTSFRRFAKRTMMPKGMQMVFSSFARAFFAEPEKMSMAELIKSFHFYFLSNDLGLIYEVLDDDFEHSFLKYCRDYIEGLGGNILLDHGVSEIVQQDNGFSIEGKKYDYAVLATDVKATKGITERSKSLHGYENTYRQLTSLKASGNYVVYKIWTDRFEADESLPCYVFTDRLKCLDSVSLYHKMEKESAEWSRRNGGGIFELHTYILPEDLQGEEEIKKALLEEFIHYFPEMEGVEIKHEFYQFRSDFTAYHTGLHADRPSTVTEVPGLYLAGDWVKMDNCTMLMEAAYTSGALAANAILSKESLQENPLHSVPQYGLFS